MPEVVINLENCKGCGLCLEVCPKGLLEFAKEINPRGVRPVVSQSPKDCTGCRLCFRVCPDVVITIYE